LDTQTQSRQTAHNQTFSDLQGLCNFLQLDANSLPLLTEFKHFPLKVPRGFAELMEKGNPHDPLLRQILPLSAELINYPGYSNDPVGDLHATVIPGVIQKYQGRLLLIVTGACAVHCRYCFRRNFPYGEQQLSSQKLEEAINYIAQANDIHEVILSGGDPLLLSTNKLSRLFQRLADIEHIRRIRIHSRVPVVNPAQITPHLIAQLQSASKQIVMVLHSNHSQELGSEFADCCRRLSQAGITLFNQSVLLKGVNDNSAALCALSERLFQLQVIPYYLHVLDQAQGTGHFAVPEQQAKELLKDMQERLPGYLVPKLVREQAGALYKLPV
jgi:L-lysine 2,3-aminomutase